MCISESNDFETLSIKYEDRKIGNSKMLAVKAKYLCKRVEM